MSLPQYQTDDTSFTLMQNQWSTQINPLLRNPSLQSVLLKNITLVTGSNQVNHLLGRKLQGWRIVRLRASAAIYDTQDSNPIQDKTLLLVSDAGVNVDIEVF